MVPTPGRDRVTSYDVRIWKIRTYKGRRGTTYTVRWTVAGQEWSDTFKTYALADSARGELLAAARIGEAFDVATGRPISKSARREEQSWFDFACRYVDLKWPTAAGNTRRGIAETLASATPALFASERNRPSDETIRGALHGWAFNTTKRAAGEPDDEDQAAAVRWLRRNTVPVSALAEPATLRATLDLLARKLDGAAAAGSTVRRKRAVLHNALEYAVEVGVLVSNPMSSLKWKAPKVAEAVDRRVVVNPKQASQLLDAVGVQGRTGRHLVAFFGAMYYSALRPGEAADLREASLELPDEGWGQLILSRSAPTTGTAWSNSGQRRDHRQLKPQAPCRRGRAGRPLPTAARRSAPGAPRRVRRGPRGAPVPGSARRSALRERLQPGLAEGPREGVQPALPGSLAARRAALRPAARGRVDMAGRRGRGDPVLTATLREKNRVSVR